MNKIFKYLIWLLFITMIIIIFSFSNMNSNNSNSRSKDIIRFSIKVVDKTFHMNLNDEEVNDLVNKYNYPFRKVCHFSEYFLLSLLLIIALRISNISINKSIIITM